MKLLSNRSSLILCCALFNILFEYSARGITELRQSPLLFLFMFGIYFTYFAMSEDLMLRYRLSNFQIVLLGLLYGTIPETFLTRNLFNPNIFWGFTLAGINIGSLILIGVCAWGVLQGNLTFYLANRVQPRDRGHPRMGVFGWTVCILYQLTMIVLASRNPAAPHGTAIGYLFVLVFEIAVLRAFVWTLKMPRRDDQAFTALPIMDVLAFGSVLLFFVLGTFFSHGATIVTSRVLNLGAVVAEMAWTIFVAIVFFAYRLWRRREIVI